MNSKQSYILSSNCLFVKGHSKNLLIDLQRGDWYHVDFVIEETDIALDEIDQETLEHLIANQIIIKVPDHIKDQFPKISYEYDFPAIIESAIIDRNEQSSYSIKQLISTLDNLLTKFYQIRFFDKTLIKDLQTILDCTERAIVESIDFIMPFEEGIYDYVSLNMELYPKVNSVIFTGCNGDMQKFKTNDKFVFTTQNVTSETCCGFVHPSFFSNNKKHIFKSMNFNSCLYKKVGIDVKGNVKNCPSMKEVICSAEDLPLFSAKQLETDYWFIQKDEIDVCKDCEFRYICTDCRVRVDSNKYSRPSTCLYNPYTNLWKGQKGYEKPELYNKQ